MDMNFFEMVKKWTLNDYRTPGIKAEVILDMLISEFIEDIIRYDCFKKGQDVSVTLLSKEVPIRINTSNLNAKVDYLVSVGNRKLVMVELKTTNESFSDPQLKRMENAVKRGVSDFLGFYQKIAEEIPLSTSAKKKYKYSRKMYMDNLEENSLKESDFSKLDYMYILLTKSDQVPDKKIILTDYFKNDDFNNSLSENRCGLWNMVSEILQRCASFYEGSSN